MFQFFQRAIVILLRLGLGTLIMKKIILCLLFFIFLLPEAAFSSDNFIYSIDVSRNPADKNVTLDIKSDYMTKVTNKVDEIGREYFDIKDASLKENFSVKYNEASGVESVIAQQIGNKVRIYVKGENTEGALINFNNVENQPYPDRSAGYALCIFALISSAILILFKKKAKRLNDKAKILHNTASRAVYNNLMEKKPNTSSNVIRDNRNLTLNNIKKEQIKSIAEYQKQRFADRVAM